MQRRAAILAASLAATPAAAGAPLVDCWDGTFAYTMAGLRPAEAGFKVRITSQNEVIFAPLFPEAELDWGQAVIEATFVPEGCVADAERALFTCYASAVSLTLTQPVFGGDPASTHSAAFQGLTVEMVDVIRAGAGGPVKRLILQGQRDGTPVALGATFDHPEYCDGTWSAFDPP